MLPSEYIIREHYRLRKSSCAIISRTFCRIDAVEDLNEVRHIFEREIPKIRELEKE